MCTSVIVTTVQFAETMYSANEGSGIVFEIILTSQAAVEVTVQFTTEDDTAQGENVTWICSVVPCREVVFI